MSIEVDRVNDTRGGVIITVIGPLDRHDVAVLSMHLHSELDAHPSVVVVNFDRATCCDAAGGEVLATAHERARLEGRTALHVVDPSQVLVSRER